MLLINGLNAENSPFENDLDDSFSSDDPLSAPSFTETVKAHGTVSSGTESFSLADGAYHTVTAGGDFTVSFAGWEASGEAQTLVMKVTNGGAHTITWDAAIDWPAGSEPSLTASGTDILVFVTDDGGTTVYGRLAMEDVQ